jgi:hypothetical protein
MNKLPDDELKKIPYAEIGTLGARAFPLTRISQMG